MIPLTLSKTATMDFLHAMRKLHAQLPDSQMQHIVAVGRAMRQAKVYHDVGFVVMQMPPFSLRRLFTYFQTMPKLGLSKAERDVVMLVGVALAEHQNMYLPER